MSTDTPPADVRDKYAPYCNAVRLTPSIAHCMKSLNHFGDHSSGVTTWPNDPPLPASSSVAVPAGPICQSCREGHHLGCTWDEDVPPDRCVCKCPPVVDAAPAVSAEPPRPDGCLCHPAGSAPTGEVYMAPDADCPQHGEKPNQLRSALTRAQRMLALHSRDWGIQNNDAILWAVLHGWNGDPDDPEDCGAWGEMAARFGWSDELVADLRCECAAVEAITDPAPPAGTPVLPEAATALDLDAIRDEFLNQCGPCDFGLVEYGCNCPTSDYRPPMSALVEEVKRLRAALSHLQGETAAERAKLATALNAAGNQLAFHSRDWSEDRRDAWLWGILCGWDGGEPGTMDELAAKFGWDAEAVALLRTHRAAVEALDMAPDAS